MPKLSVSVPDDLWEAARRRAGSETKTSQLVQQALQLYVDRGRRGVRLPEDVDEKRFAEVLQILVDSHHGEYRRGYDAGIGAAEIVGLFGVQLVAATQPFKDWEQFERILDDATPDEASYEDTAQYDASMETLKHLFTEGTFNTVFQDGALQAFADLREAFDARLLAQVDVDDEDGDSLDHHWAGDEVDA